MDRSLLYNQYRSLLAEGIVPFWLTHGVDREHGGVFSCMRDDGALLSTEKYTWSQARWVWTLSALYNRFEKRAEFLELAQKTIDFLLAFARDEQGRFVFRTTREGRPLEGATSLYADFFVVYGISEYCRAVPDAGLIDEAQAIFQRICKRVEQPDFRETAPYLLPPGRRPFAVPMMLTLVADELAQTTGESRWEQVAEEAAATVMDRFVKQPKNLVYEYLGRDYAALAPNEGTFIMPGHAIECMWFVMHWARRRGDQAAIGHAAETIRAHLEAGWDSEFGGIFLGIDANGGTPFLPNAEKKVWWPHTEALYALLLAHELTGQAWCMEWYRRVHEYSFARFPMSGTGEWYQRLDRRGNPVTDLVALPVKDPFHLPRAVVLILELLGEQ